MPKLLSIGMMAERNRRPLHRVKYVIMSRGIEPVERIGNIRLFSEEQFRRITRELAEIEKAESLKVRRRREPVS